MPIGLQYAAQSDPGDSSRGAYINERNDICGAIRGSEDEWKEKKVSGSAYKLTSSRAYHHGTMLLSSNLSELGTALKQSRSTMISKGVPSVPSPVVNLREAFPSRDIFLTHERFAGAIQSEFEALYGTARMMMIDHTDASLKQLPAPIMEEIEKSCAEMRSWEWTWGQTPSFTHRIKQGHRLDLGDDLRPIEPFEVEIAVENGTIISSKLHIRGTGREDHDLSQFIQQLVSQRYDDLALRPDTIGAIGGRFVQEQGRDCKPSTNERMLVLRAKVEQWLRLVL
jgi:lipoate-protein ligase A